MFLEIVKRLSATKLTDVSTVLVSSEYPYNIKGKWLKLAQMLDDNPSTFWHSSGDGKSWARVVFDKSKTVTKVGLTVRKGNCTLRGK